MRSAKTQAASIVIYTNSLMASGVHGEIIHTSVITTLWLKGLSRNSAVASLHEVVRPSPSSAEPGCRRGWVSDMDAGMFDFRSGTGCVDAIVPLMESA